MGLPPPILEADMADYPLVTPEAPQAADAVTM